MRLGLNVGYSGKRASAPLELVRAAEAAGFDSVWVAEAYGSDAVSIASWLLAHTTRIRVGTAIMQMPARTPNAPHRARDFSVERMAQDTERAYAAALQPGMPDAP